MSDLSYDAIMQRLAQTPLIWWVIWAGLLAMTISLLVLMRTRWGQSQPLRKCLALSVLAHLLMASYATTVQIVHTTIGPPRERSVRVSSVNLEADENAYSEHSAAGAASSDAKAWETFADLPLSTLETPEAARADTNVAAAVPPEPSAATFPALPTPSAESAPLPPDEPAAELAETAMPPPDRSPEHPAALEEVPAAQKEDAAAQAVTPIESLPRAEAAASIAGATAPENNLPAVLGTLAPSAAAALDAPSQNDPAAILADVNDRLGRDASPMLPAPGANDAQAPASGGETKPLDLGQFVMPQAPRAPTATSASSSPLAGALVAGAAAPSLLTPVFSRPGSEGVPEIYRGRVERESGEHDHSSGATAETEQAVHEALHWLVANQSRDGRWDAQRFGAGTERRELGPRGTPEDRQAAGTRADTGVTGLALLAFLGAGHTHLTGEHRETVRRGLDYLLLSQRADGNLGGESTVYAFMYCHGMATFALSEAYAMTGDKRLEQPVRRAINFTLASQHPGTGGWRYRPGELGDMSQLGWQLMGLKSASLAGIDVPRAALDRAARFIRSVTFGAYGGVASYRPGEQASRSMTAEALASRQFLGELAGDDAASREAADYILQELPGKGKANLYYWYYASLAMHNMQGKEWATWNDALRRELLATQETDGPMTGTWPTDSLWAGYGGRVYTTAMGALCLEVYYRYLPIYLEASAQGKKVR